MKIYCRVSLIVALFVITLLAAILNAQGPTNKEGIRAQAQTLAADDLFAGLRWRNIGPFHGGRISAVSGATYSSNPSSRKT